MIHFKAGNILAQDAEALVNTVNCVGVMGRGLALQFKKAFPEDFRAYAEACKGGGVRPGRMFVFETRLLANPRFIVNFPTKRHWRDKSRIEDIQAGLDDLATVIRERGIRSIAVPPLGCGLGGLEWCDVRPRIEETFRGFDNLDVVVFEPGGAPEAERGPRGREAASVLPQESGMPTPVLDESVEGDANQEEVTEMTNWTTCAAVERNPRKISGAWAFTGTRVPVYALFESLESGATVNEFLEWYPEVKPWQVAAVLKHEAEALRTTLQS